MARKKRGAEPWYWQDRKGWYVWVGKVRHPLVKGPEDDETEAAARLAWHTLLARLGVGGPAEPDAMKVGELVSLFLARPESEVAASTKKRRVFYLRGFSKTFHSRRVATLRPHEVRRWYEAKETWSETSRGVFVGLLKACMAWGLREGYIEANPLATLSRPTCLPRPSERLLTPAQLAKVIEAAPDDQFRDLAVFVASVGCRPGEAMRIEAKDVDLDGAVVTLKEHKTAKRTRKPRRIVLDGLALAIVRRLCEREPVGPIFRNPVGSPWTASTVSKRICAMRARGIDLPHNAGLYSARHIYITDLLSAGVPPAVVAALAGNSLAVISKHYDHTDERTDVLREALAKIRETGRPGEDPVRPASDPAGP